MVNLVHYPVNRGSKTKRQRSSVAPINLLSPTASTGPQIRPYYYQQQWPVQLPVCVRHLSMFFCVRDRNCHLHLSTSSRSSWIHRQVSGLKWHQPQRPRAARDERREQNKQNTKASQWTQPLQRPVSPYWRVSSPNMGLHNTFKHIFLRTKGTKLWISSSSL